MTADDAARASEGGGGDDAARVAALTAALGGLREKVKRRDAATAEVITGTVERLRLAEADGARLQLELRSTQLALEAAKQATPVESTQVKTHPRDHTFPSVHMQTGPTRANCLHDPHWDGLGVRL